MPLLLPLRPRVSRLAQLKWLVLGLCLCGGISGSVADGELLRVEIRSREPYLAGRAFGPHGAFETLRGKAYFALDPQLDANRTVVDLELAPRNPLGRIEFSTDLEILSPVDPTLGNGVVLYDVNNRGNPTALRQFNSGADEFLARHGFILVWSGWSAEVQPGGRRLRLDAPIAHENGKPLRGIVRFEMVSDREASRLSIAQWANQGAYPPTKEGEERATLTWRLREQDPRVAIPREQWRLEQRTIEADGESGQLPQIELVLSSGFQPGYLYELVYEAQGSRVQGTGLAGIRDLVSAIKYSRNDNNPLRTSAGAPAIRYAYGFGTSQSGRCLRQFLYDGFNTDEHGRQVFDAVMPHVAGGGLGFFNHRFAMPTRHNAQHDSHCYPADMFPFAYDDQRDPFSERTDGILRRARAAGTVPKIMHTQTSSEYWHRSGSLVHTDPLGKQDTPLPPEVRVYAFGGCQHGAGSGLPGPRGNGQLPANPADYRPLLRGLLLALDRWVRTGQEPPPSVYPQVSEKTLVSWRQEASGWLPLPRVRYPEVIQRPEFLDRGVEFFKFRRITQEPPLRRGEYVVRIPAYGSDNNELGTLLLPAVAVPVGTYTSWNLRHRSVGAENELLTLTGGFIPLASTEPQRRETGDPRPALSERYQNFEDYRRRFLEVARQLVAQKYVDAEEMPRFETSVERYKSFFEP
jgi:hypothetical protein